MCYIVCGTHAEILKERKETGSSILERMCKARCRRGGIHARSDEERISLTVAPATVSMIKILRAYEATKTRKNLDISEFFLYFVRNL